MEPDTCDVLIAGAGPAGSTAAFILAGRGFKVALVDRCPFPRPKLCGGLLTWKTVRSLERIFQTGLPTLQSAGVIRVETRRYTVADRRGHALTRRLDDPFHLVDRSVYDEFWLRRAVAAGAEFHPAAAVVSLDPGRGEASTGDGRRWRWGSFFGTRRFNARSRSWWTPGPSGRCSRSRRRRC